MSVTLNEIIGCNIRFLRQEQGLSTEDLARLAYMSVGAINNIENNKYKRQINRTNIETIARALRVGTDVLTEENDELEAMFQEAESLLRNKQYGQTTIQLGDKLMEITADRGPAERTRALIIRGKIDYNRAQFVIALQRYQSALDFAVMGIHRHLIHEARYYVASTLFVLEKLEDALKLINLDLQESKLPEYKAKMYYTLGFVYGMQGNLKDSEVATLKALEENEQKMHKDEEFEGRCHQALSETFRRGSQWEKSIFHSQIAYDLATKSHDYIGKIYAKKTIAEALFSKGDLTAARSVFLEALEEAKGIVEFRPLEMNKILFAIAYCDEDYPRLKEILEGIEKINVAPKELATMYKDAAQLAMILGYHEDGRIHFLKGLEVLGVN